MNKIHVSLLLSALTTAGIAVFMLACWWIVQYPVVFGSLLLAAFCGLTRACWLEYDGITGTGHRRDEA